MYIPSKRLESTVCFCNLRGRLYFFKGDHGLLNQIKHIQNKKTCHSGTALNEYTEGELNVIMRDFPMLNKPAKIKK